jgi:hypothetical protein
MRQKRGAGVLAALVLALLEGCTTFGTDEPSSDGGAGASDSAAGPLLSEGFETDRAGCGDWEAKAGTTVRAPARGRSGQSACRICSAAAANSYFGATTRVAAQAGTYSLEAYVRQVSGDPAGLAAAFDVGGSFMEGAQAPGPPDWTLVTKSVTVADGVALTAVISGRSSTTGIACFLVDDIVVRKER